MSDNETLYRVTGMKCGGCEAAAKAAVAVLPGYVDAVFDAKAGTGVVKGDVAPAAVMEALKAAGYPGKPAT